MISSIYPYPLSAYFINARAAQQAAAGLASASRTLSGLYFYVRIYDAKGVAFPRFTFRYDDVLSSFPTYWRVPYMYRSTYRITIQAVEWRHGRHVFGEQVLMPRPRKNSKAPRVVPATHLKTALHKARRSLVERRKALFPRRAKLTPVKTARLSPERYYRNFPFRYIKGGTLVSSYDMPLLVYDRSWAGTVTPGYASKRPQELPVNNHSVTILKEDDGGLYWQVNRYYPAESTITIEPFKNNWGVYSVAPPAISHDNTAYDRALGNLKRNADVG